MSIKTYFKRGLRYILKGPEIINHRPIVNVKISYTQPNNRLCGKNILITGGNKGIGLSLATKFVSEGAKVLIVGRDKDSLIKESRKLNCHYICADLQDFKTLENIIIEADALLGGINCLVNNAGVSLHEGDIRNVSEEQFDKQFNTNLKSAYFLSKYFVQDIEKKKTPNGKILFISSERGIYVDDLPYGLTKNALNCLVRGLARRVINSDIRVNAVAPGITATQLTGYCKDDNLYFEQGITKRIYLPEEIAEIACFLLSDISNCLSGQIITCDEGRSINAYWR